VSYVERVLGGGALYSDVYSTTDLVQEVYVCIFLDLGFSFHLKFRYWHQYKFTEVCRDSLVSTN
jgi:hypothetical protein